jgi:hypothetical protein
MWNLRVTWIIFCVLLLNDWDVFKPITANMWALGNLFYLGPGEHLIMLALFFMLKNSTHCI